LNKKISTVWVAIAFLVLATTLFLLPGSSFPKQNWWTPFFKAIRVDKIVHAIIFFLLVYLWCKALHYRFQLVNRKHIFRFILVIFISYGVLIEFVQENFIDNRTFEGFDILADATGAVAGYILAFKRFIKKETPVETGVVNQN